MTNKEVLDRMYAGEVFQNKNGTIIYKIENDNIVQDSGHLEWEKSFLYFEELHLLKPFTLKQELPTWYFLTIAFMDRSHIDNWVVDKKRYGELLCDDNAYIISKKEHQALTKLDAIKEFYKC